MRKILLLIFVITIYQLLFISSIVFATLPLDSLRDKNILSSPPIEKLGNPDNPVSGSVIYVFLQLLKWLIAVFWIVAVGFVIWSAFTFLFADGDEGKIGEAKNRLKYAVIAAAVALLSTGINVIVYYLLGGAN